MMEIKICGITNLEDAINACACGADALGFIFYLQTPRYVTPVTARDIIKRLPREIAKVGVFVNHDIQFVKDIYDFCGLDLIQLHGDESPEYCRHFPDSILIKALSPRNEEDLNIVKNYFVKAIVIDSRNAGRYGGTGKKSNWELAVKVKETHTLVLSGGLNADNIQEAIETVSPHAVDVNSGVEVSPQKKDPEKVRAIIEIVHKIESESLTPIFTRRRHYAPITAR